MKDLNFIILLFCVGFISNIDIEFNEEAGIFDFILGETYNFYVPMNQSTEIEVIFIFETFTYLPFNCTFINEYSSRKGASIRNKTIENFEYYIEDGYHMYDFFYSLEDFSSTYLSFSITPNTSIENVEIELYFSGVLYNMSSGVEESFGGDVVPLYLAIPAKLGSKINVDLKVSPEDCSIKLALIEFQKNNSDYYIYVKENYTFDYKVYIYQKIISFDYVIKNTNTNFFCLKISSNNYDIDDIYATLTEDKYYYTFNDKNSIDVFNLMKYEIYLFNLKVKTNQFIDISFSIFGKDFDDNHLPLKEMIIYETMEEFDSDNLTKEIHYIKAISESFSYIVTQPETKYLLLSINPSVNFEKFNIAYNIIETTTSYKLENNTLLSLSDLYHDISYYLNISSKILDTTEYEITIKNTNISSVPFKSIYIYEYPSNKNHYATLNFKQVGKDLKCSSYFRITNYNTKQAYLKIVPKTNIKSMSVKVNTKETKLYNLNKEVKKNIGHIISKQDYYFAIDLTQNFDKKDISVNIEFKYKSDFRPTYLINYYMESKEEFKLDFGFTNFIDFEKKDNKFYGTTKFEFNFNSISYNKYEVLLINAIFEKDLDDFIIEYKYFDKKNESEGGKKNNLPFIIAPISVCVAIISLVIVIRQCRKKNANSNLIADTNGSNANLLPK